MYKLTRRSNFLLPFCLILLVGIVASIWIPGAFPTATAELPAFALVPGEIAIALIFSVLLFENAAPADIIKLAGIILCITLMDGAIGNLVGKNSEWLADGAMRLNWIQLISWNITGLCATLALFTTETEEESAMRMARERESNREKDSREASAVATKEPPAPSKIDFSPAAEAKPVVVEDKESAKEILGSLDVARINKLEESISLTPEKVSLESLFAEETQAAAQKASKESAAEEWSQQHAPEPQPIAAIEESPAPAPSFELPAATFELDLDDLSVAPAHEPEPGWQSEPVAATSEPVAETPQPVSPPTGGLLRDVSADLDDIFSDLAPVAAQNDFSPAKLSKPEPVVPPELAPAPSGGLLNVSDNDLTDMFDNLLEDPAAATKEVTPVPAAEEPAAEEPAATPEPAAPVVEEPAPVAAEAEAPAVSGGPKLTDAGSQAVTAVKEFGKLAVAANVETGSGTLKTIGQMLLDTKAVEKMLKAVGNQETGAKWRVLTVDRGADLQAMMNRLAEFEGVESALLIGKDGLLLGNTESVSAMKYVYGPLSLAMHSTTNLGTAKLQMGELRQAVLKSGETVSILTDVGTGILAVFGKWDVSKIDPLLDLINTVASGGSTDVVTEQEGAPILSEAPAAQAPVETPAPPAPVEAAPAAEGGLLNVSDGEVSDLFDNLLGGEEAKAEPAPAPASEPAPAAPAASGLLNVSDGEVSDLFDNLLGGDEAEPKKPMDFSPKEEAPPAPAAEPVKSEKKDGKPAKQMKEFGKLSANAMSKPDSGQEQGSMKSIGRQLIDVQAVENIIKAGEKREKIGSGLTTARVISAARGEGIKTLLSKIDTYEGVVGSLIVGHDGLVIASTLQSGIDKDMMGALCSALHSHLDIAAKKLEKGKLQQVVFLGQSPNSPDTKLTVLTAVAVGILAVFVDQCQMERLDGLLQAIETTVKG